MNDDGKDPNPVSLLLLYSMILWGFCDARKVGRLDFAEITKRRLPPLLVVLRRYPQDLITLHSFLWFIHLEYTMQVSLLFAHCASETDEQQYFVVRLCFAHRLFESCLGEFKFLFFARSRAEQMLTPVIGFRLATKSMVQTFHSCLPMLKCCPP